MKTVGQVIRELQEFDPDLPLTVVQGHKDGYVSEYTLGVPWAPSFKDIDPNHKPTEVRVMLETLPENNCAKVV